MSHDVWVYLAESYQLHDPELQSLALDKVRSICLHPNPSTEAMTDHYRKWSKAFIEYSQLGPEPSMATKITYFKLSWPKTGQFSAELGDFNHIPEELRTWKELEQCWKRCYVEAMKEEYVNMPTEVLARVERSGEVKQPEEGKKGNKKKKGRSNSGICHLCGQSGHWKIACPNKGSVNAASYQYYSSGLSPYSKTHFMVNSGASSSVCFNCNLFIHYLPLQYPLSFQQYGTQSTILAQGIGTIAVHDQYGNNIHINNVYHVPKGTGCLLSYGRLLKAGWTIKLENNTMGLGDAVVWLSTEQHLSGVLWYAPAGETVKEHGTINFIGSVNPVYDEHVCLGHPSSAKLLKLHNAACTKVKLQEHDIRAFCLAECAMVHMDIIGPYDPSRHNNWYALVMVEDFTKINHIVCLPGKTELLKYIKEFIARLECQLNTRIRFIRSDNGTEFTSEDARQWYAQKGIIHQTSTRYMPAQNGVCERFVRMIKEMAECMLASSELGHQYWDYAIRYASVVYMKTALGVDKVSAWERLTGWQTNAKEIREFSDHCFVHIPKEVRAKNSFDMAKATKAQLLGLDIEKTGWVVLVENTNKIERSSDLVTAADTPFIIDKELPGKPMQVTAVPPSEAIMRKVVKFVDIKGDNVKDDEEDREEQEGQSKVHNKHQLALPEALNLGDELSDEDNKNIPAEAPLDHSSNKDTIQSQPTNPQQRSKRDTRVPSHLASDYIMSQVTSAVGEDPKTAKEALVAADWIDWQRAMDEELKVIKDKDVWEETNLPKGKKAIGVKWVFKKKLNGDGQVNRYKARLVAQGFTQRPGVDFELTFAPTSRLSTLRLVLIITAKEDLDIAQADVKSAYLNGQLDEEIFMRYPQAVKPKEGCNVLRLKASLYGLKQSGRVWWIQLKEAMIAQGFKRCDFDWGLYVQRKSRHSKLTLVMSYVNDLIITAPSREEIDGILKGFQDQQNRSFFISQTATISSLYDKFPSNSRQKSTPLPHADLQSITDDQSSSVHPQKYQELIGSIQWLAGTTRPDIAFSASYLARFAAAPRETHWQMALRVVSYLVQTKEKGLILRGMPEGKRDSMSLEGWVDTDLAGCLDSRHSMTGYIFKVGDSIVDWQSKWQATASPSTLESEYVAMSEAAKHGVYLQRLLEELGYKSEKVPLNCDNMGAISLANNPSFHSKTKHIDIRIHMICDYIEYGYVSLSYI
ncbi:hypothetical protein D1P53_001305 [Cryptococcus gattii VGV]|nr:hypothetical protein D1P53_001305 [Cryptococcus gattii VGV]